MLQEHVGRAPSMVSGCRKAFRSMKLMQRLEVGGGSGQAKGGRWEVPGRANRPCIERRDGTQWPEADGSVSASLGLKMMSGSNDVIQVLKYCIFDFMMAQRVKNLPSMQVTQETVVQSPGQEDPLEEKMATHSSILAWEIPRTEDPGRLQSMGLQRVGHD